MSIYKSGFNKKNLQVLRQELEAVLVNAGIEGISLDLGNGRFNEAEVTFKMSAKVKGLDTPEDQFLKARLASLGCVMQKGSKKLVGYNSRSYKYPFIYEENGKRFKAAEDFIKFHFAK
jgi:hypothetical protein